MIKTASFLGLALCVSIPAFAAPSAAYVAELTGYQHQYLMTVSIVGIESASGTSSSANFSGSYYDDLRGGNVEYSVCETTLNLSSLGLVSVSLIDEASGETQTRIVPMNIAPIRDEASSRGDCAKSPALLAGKAVKAEVMAMDGYEGHAGAFEFGKNGQYSLQLYLEQTLDNNRLAMSAPNQYVLNGYTLGKASLSYTICDRVALQCTGSDSVTLNRGL